MKKPIKVAPRRQPAPQEADRAAAVAAALNVDRDFAVDLLDTLACPNTWTVQEVVEHATAWFD
jgi:hypothetical protein